MAKMTLNEALSIFGQTELDSDLRDGGVPGSDELLLNSSPRYGEFDDTHYLVCGFVSGHSSDDVVYSDPGPGAPRKREWERGFEAGCVCRNAGL